MKHFLEVRELSARAGQLALNIPHLRLFQSETHCLIGRSGSGKSLLATALAGLHVPGIEFDGRVFLDGKTSDRQLWKNHVFLLPQEPSLALDPTMSVGKQIAEVFKWRLSADCIWPDVSSVAREVGLADADLSKTHTALSGGMQQRVMIAMALVANASFVIADEPTKGLDSFNKARIIELFQKLQKLGRGLLIITHDLDVARKLAGTISVIDQGSVVEQGPAEQILTHPQSIAARILVESEPARWPQDLASQPAAQAPVVSLSAATFGFAAGRPLIKDVSLEICPGQIVGLFGPSGVGKSTLGDLCLALNAPLSGGVSWHGSPVTRRLIKQYRSRFQKLFQNPVTAFPPNLMPATVFERLTPITNDTAPPLQELLHMLDLNTDLLKRYPSQISGGELQRLAIARVLMGQPDFIVCDEPSSRLDTSVQRQTIDVIVSYVRNRNAGALLISHDLDILRKRADQIFQLTETGGLAEINKDKVTDYVA